MSVVPRAGRIAQCVACRHEIGIAAEQDVLDAPALVGVADNRRMVSWMSTVAFGLDPFQGLDDGGQPCEVR
jgi:hypothetical protein